MANVRLTWKLPSVSLRQRAIQHAKVEIRVDASLPWTLQDQVPPDATQALLFQDVAPGTHYYRVTVVDADGQEGPPAETSADVPYDPPGTVTDLTATVE